ncbi:HNH endonuclease signature motif containing protein [Rhodococcoides fascians]|uniref:HNH endonuclease signature motif containing protein n=1 Tax=Rhodococcoides fascians TaxID=1828 RepID=UPI000562D6FE|nr:HNH endonuclease signature motif containing protein [Rhodococcus fascians]
MIEKGTEDVGRMQTAGLHNADRRALLVRMEVVRQKLFAYSHTWIADLVDQRGLDDIYGSVPEALSVLLRSSGTRAGQRIRLAMEFGERTSVTGERLEPLSPNTLRGAEDGLINEEHQQIIRKFFWRLGSKVDIETREKAEAQLAELARQLSPDHLKAAASRLYDLIDPDGDDEDPARVADRCYVQFDEQGSDGLSRGKMVVDSELRAYIEAVFDKWAKPGQANPADPPPVVDSPDDADGCDDRPDQSSVPKDATGDGQPAEGEPVDEEAAARARRDLRGRGRRQHDAMKMVFRQILASGKLGMHRGLPVTAVLTMSVKDLEAASGHAVTATGSLVEMRDAIRMASHAYQCLVIFDNDERPLQLRRAKRLASADQRIVLIAADRGCSFPGCTRPATWSQVHHIEEWAAGGNTDIEDLTFGCDRHHPLVGPKDTDWATTKAGPDHPYPGRTLWHSPTTLDPLRRGLLNHYHHPDEYIRPIPELPLFGPVDSIDTETSDPETNDPEPGNPGAARE